MRYMVPVVPLLMVLAAGLMAAIWYGELWPRRTKRVIPPDEPPAAPSVDTAEQPAPIPTAGQTDQKEVLQASDEPDTAARHGDGGPIRPRNSRSTSRPTGTIIDVPRRIRTATCNPATCHPATCTLTSPPPATRWLAAAIAIAALLGAIFWSLAYVNGVYNTSHPWIKASRWIYANIPDGSTIAWEQWDNSLPYDLPEPNSSRGRFQFTDWGPFEEDTPEKFERLKESCAARRAGAVVQPHLRRGRQPA